MDPASIEKLLGIGFASAVAVAAILYVVKGAVAKAVELAAQKEIERLKADFSKELEKERQSFARELERERAAASRELELFKAELSTKAEVRRQVAVRRVQAVQEIVSIGEPLLRVVMNARGDCPDKMAEVMVSLNQYSAKVRELAHYFEEPVAQRLYTYAGILLDAKTRWEHKHDPSAFGKASEAYGDMLNTIRRELEIPVSMPKDYSAQ